MLARLAARVCARVCRRRIEHEQEDNGDEEAMMYVYVARQGMDRMRGYSPLTITYRVNVLHGQ